MSTGAKVAGRCPMGCGETLMLGSGGHVTCGYLPCPNPFAVADVLDDEDIARHVVKFDVDGFSILHPLSERPGNLLFDCELLAYCLALDGPPVQPGRYVATPDGERWAFTSAPTSRSTEAGG